MIHAVALFVHLVAVVYWIGGIFFVQTALRPVLPLLQQPERLTLLSGALQRYFLGVGISIALVFASGLAMMFAMTGSGSLFAVPWRVHAMLGTALVMALVYGHTMAAPFARLKRGVAARDWEAASVAMQQIRSQALGNLTLGLGTIAIATIGRVA